ncbi:hypothetical protein scyTo_0000412, partial [Scyliorhinus torazame]|nr:hypothetical protein [Scyliorhinus torazame]
NQKTLLCCFLKRFTNQWTLVLNSRSIDNHRLCCLYLSNIGHLIHHQFC